MSSVLPQPGKGGQSDLSWTQNLLSHIFYQILHLKTKIYLESYIWSFNTT